MKKTLISLVIAAALLIPTASHAQMSQEDTQALLVSSLQQVILLLTKQVEILMAQLVEMQRIQTPVVTQPTNPPVTTTPTPTPTPTPPQNGSIAPVAEAPVDKSEIVVLTTKSLPDPAGGMIYGAFNFKITVLNKDGKSAFGTPVKVSFPSDAIYPRNENKTPEEDLKDNSNINKTLNGKASDEAEHWYTSFQYIPATTGTKTITFTSGNLTKSVTVEVN